MSEPLPPSALHRLPLRALVRLRADRVLQRLRGQPAAILMYHGLVRDGSRPPLWTQLELSRFASQMRFLAEHRPVLSLETLVEGLQGQRTLPPSTVAITFDDGFQSVLDLALPVLRRYQLPATLFVTTGYIGSDRLLWIDSLYECYQPEMETMGPEWLYAQIRLLKRLPDAERRRRVRQLLDARGGPPRIEAHHPRRLLDADGLRRLQDSGLITIGGHAVTHGLLSRMPAIEVESELQRCRSDLHAILGTPAQLFAYPDGAFTPLVARLTRRAGFRAAVSTQPGPIRPGDDLFALKRYPIGGQPSLERFQLQLAGLDDALRRVSGRRLAEVLYG